MTDQQVRWGVAATGGIAARFAAAMQLVDDGGIVAVASRSQERADEFGDAHGIGVRHGSLAALADDPDVDAVYVASPHAFHAADAIRFLDAGKHVLCEKPLALDEAEAATMVAASRRQGVFLMEAIWSRFLPAYVHLRDLLDQGRIRTPTGVEASLGFAFPFDPDHRLFDPELGGGALLDLGIYPIQLCSLVLGPPDEVSGLGHLGPTGVDERVAAVLHHADGGLGVIQASITSSLACTARITGTGGWIDVPALMQVPQHVSVTTPAGTEVIDGSFEGEGLRFQVPEVHRCIRAGLVESPVVPHEETLAMARTMDRIRAQIGLRYPGETA
ncbi:Gfo/Idh/MocA family protein [Aquihabitans sp. McL0605]|uniref:Gfo/Idh/MocA family protein n=1 Tax=Aquihabitans sp. McL0605 TaxID=3415671 RepID=UPI003CF626A7